jgi:hypothetical protein
MREATCAPPGLRRPNAGKAAAASLLMQGSTGSLQVPGSARPPATGKHAAPPSSWPAQSAPSSSDMSPAPESPAASPAAASCMSASPPSAAAAAATVAAVPCVAASRGTRPRGGSPCRASAMMAATSELPPPPLSCKRPQIGWLRPGQRRPYLQHSANTGIAVDVGSIPLTSARQCACRKKWRARMAV